MQTKLDEISRLPQIISNTGWLFADRVLRIGVGLIVGAWIARYLGPEQFGLYSYAIAFVGMFGFLAALGLESIVVRELVRTPECKDETLATTFALKFVGGIAVIAVSLATIPVLRPNDSLSWWLVAVIGAGLVFQAFDAIDYLFQAQVKSRYTVVARNTAFVIMTAVRILLLYMGAPLLAFACAASAEIALGAMGLLAVYRRRGHAPPKWRGSLARARTLLTASWPLALSSLAVWGYMRVDQLMLGTMADDRSLGIYSAAVRLAEAWYFVPMVIVSSVFPSILQLKKQDPHLYYQRIQRLFNLMSALSYAVVIPTSFLAGPIITLLFGPSYLEAAPILVVLLWSGLFVSLGVAREAWIVSEGLMPFSLAATSVGAVSNVALNLLLIPRYGGMGAAVATLVAQWLAVSLSTLFRHETRQIFRMQAKAVLLWGGIRL